jgi:hypothetical protein
VSETGFAQFLRAFMESWFTKMSGPLTIPFAIAALFVPQVWLKLLCAVLALLCGGSASYAIWRRERQAFITERDKNLRPEIAVSIADGTLEASSRSQAGYRTPANLFVNEFWACITLFPAFVNKRPCLASIDSCSLRIKTSLRTIEMIRLRENRLPDDASIDLTKPTHLSEMEQNVLLTPGPTVTRFVQFVAELWKEELPEAELLFRAVDSFGGQWEATARLADLKVVGEMPDF